MTSAHSERLFFALWPDAVIQAEFVGAAKQLQQACGGHRTRRENMHLTLAFLGETESEKIPAVVAAASRINAQCFELAFGRLGWWHTNQVAWAAPDQPPLALHELVKNLRLDLMALGFKFDERRFFPHVSLLRKARCAGGGVDTTPIIWPVRSFALVRSTARHDGAHYAIVQRWPLHP